MFSKESLQRRRMKRKAKKDIEWGRPNVFRASGFIMRASVTNHIDFSQKRIRCWSLALRCQAATSSRAACQSEALVKGVAKFAHKEGQGNGDFVPPPGQTAITRMMVKIKREIKLQKKIMRAGIFENVTPCPSRIPYHTLQSGYGFSPRVASGLRCHAWRIHADLYGAYQL